MKPNFERSLAAILLLSPLLFGAKGGCGSDDPLDIGHDNPGECSREECGPAPGAPNWECADGTIAGPSCIRGDDGTCGYEFIECPVSCDDIPQCEFQCPEGSTNPTDSDGCVHTCECEPATCTWEDCPSPAPGALNYTCPDGTLAGPACLSSDGGCGWQFLECSTAVCPAALPRAGGTCTSVGAVCVYPGDSNEMGDWHSAAVCDSPGPNGGWQISSHYDRVVCTIEGASSRSLDVGDCAERSLAECSRWPGATDLEALTREISAVADECGGVPLESHFEARFENGCASRIAMQSPGPIDPGPLYDCMASILASRRFDCAETVECARLDPSTLR